MSTFRPRPRLTLRHAVVFVALVLVWQLTGALGALALVVPYGYSGYNSIGISDTPAGQDQSSATHMGTFFGRVASNGGAGTGADRVVCINADRSTPTYLDAHKDVSTNSQLGYLVNRYVNVGDDRTLWTPGGAVNRNHLSYPAGGAAALQAGALQYILRNALDSSATWTGTKATFARGNPTAYNAMVDQAAQLSAEAISMTSLSAGPAVADVNAKHSGGTVTGIGVRTGTGDFLAGQTYTAKLVATPEGSATFHGGKTTLTGTTSATPITLAWAVTDLAVGTNVTFEITYTGPLIGSHSYQVYSSNVAGQQDMVSAGAFAPSRLSAQAQATVAPVVLTPTVDSKAAVRVDLPGAALSDTVTVAGLELLAGHEVAVVNTMYGPFASRPPAGGPVPDGAPVFARLTKTVVPEASGAGTVTFTSPEVTAKGGYYVFVESVPEQRVAGFLVNGVVGSFGRDAETTLVRDAEVTTTVSRQDAVLGQSVADAVVVKNADGLSGKIVARLYGPFPGQVTAPPTDADWRKVVAAGLAPVTSETLAFHGSGTYTTKAVKLSSPGYWTWHETLIVQETGRKLETAYGVPTETTLVTRPGLATTASARVVLIRGAAVTDEVMVTGLGKQTGHVVAKLYGPFPGSRPASTVQPTDTEWRDAIKAGLAPVFVTSLDAVGDGTVTTAGFAPLLPGVYTWYESMTVEGSAEEFETPLGVSSETFSAVEPRLTTVAKATTTMVGGHLSDTIVLSGTGGQPGTILGELLHAEGVDCTRVDWATATRQRIKSITTSGDGTFQTESFTADRAGCWTFVETWTADVDPAVTVATSPGEPSETVRISPKPSAEGAGAATGWSPDAPNEVLVGVGAAAGTVGVALLLAPSFHSRRKP